MNRFPVDLLTLILAQRFGVSNIHPIDDAILHRMGTDCPCRPLVEQDECGGILIIHHAADDRSDDNDRARLVQ